MYICICVCIYIYIYTYMYVNRPKDAVDALLVGNPLGPGGLYVDCTFGRA